MNLYEIYSKLWYKIKRPSYSKRKVPKSLSIIKGKSLADLNKMSKIKVKPGWAVFFWSKIVDYVSHVAIVIDQLEENLNLLNAKLLHATPPGVGIAKGPFAKKINNIYYDYSGLRLCTAYEFIKENPKEYRRICIGSPPYTIKEYVSRAGQLAREIGESGLLFGKPTFYSLPLLGSLFIIGRFNYENHDKLRFYNPHLLSWKLTKSFTNWQFIYCSKLIGSIWEKVGVKNLPRWGFSTIKDFNTSTLYEYLRDQDALSAMFMWEEESKFRF